MFFKRNPLSDQIEVVKKLQLKQRALMQERVELKSRAVEIQHDLDAALAKLKVLSKAESNATGIKIAPKGIGSSEEFGEPR